MKVYFRQLLLFLSFVLHCCLVAGGITTSDTFANVVEVLEATPTTSFSSQASSYPPNATCESKTINYITHSLASICLRENRITSGVSLNAASTTSTLQTTNRRVASDTGAVATGSTSESPAETPTFPAFGTIPDEESDQESALDDTSFMSFEDWKRQTLEKEELIDAAIIDRRPVSSREWDKRKRGDGVDLEGLAEGGDIDLDFGAYLGDRLGEAASIRSKQDDVSPEKVPQNDPSKERNGDNSGYRSKDAGKTCKERFNFASLDVGGQVMKTNPEAKSASALLSENRDGYMLNTCQAKNKFFIVEMSESILVETVAMANFEFFSSTFRQFRVSVSDRYPVKLDRWVEIGTFEARNTREIQAFLVADPRIWARYLRVEFLSHFGNEFYCPVSLLRVHGRTMIQDVLTMEQGTRGDDDGDDDLEGLREGEELLVPEAVAIKMMEEDKKAVEGTEQEQAIIDDSARTAAERPKDVVNSSYTMDMNEWLKNTSAEQMTTPWVKAELDLRDLFKKDNLEEICLPSDTPITRRAASYGPVNTTVTPVGRGNVSATINVVGLSFIPSVIVATDFQRPPPSADMTKTQILSQASTIATSSTNLSSQASTMSYSSPGSSKAHNGTVTTSTKSSGTATSHIPQPTTQESFFKTISKRLQLLEANSTLSLKYIEEQSRILRDAFTKVEKRQMTKTTVFLENLNITVFEELRNFGRQYDQIWQSTVMELETQRDQSQREAAAIGARLNMLADELVFQKRMSIVQAILLLLCLAVVVFSRSFAGGYIDSPVIQSIVPKVRYPSSNSHGSVFDSTEAQRIRPPDESRAWSRSDHQRQISNESEHSVGSGSPVASLRTSFSNYSRQEDDYMNIGERLEFLGDNRYTVMDRKMVGPGSASHNTSKSRSPNWTEDVSVPHKPSKPDVPQKISDLTKDFGQRRTYSPNHTSDTASLDEQYATLFEIVENTSPGAYDSCTAGVRNQHISTAQAGLAVSAPTLPSPPPERKNSEFNDIRKPLPALPQDYD